MIKFTESYILVNDLYGTNNSISPQMGITYQPTYIASEVQSSTHEEASLGQFLQEIQSSPRQCNSINTNPCSLDTDTQNKAQQMRLLNCRDFNSQSNQQTQTELEDLKQTLKINELIATLNQQINGLKILVTEKDQQISQLKTKLSNCQLNQQILPQSQSKKMKLNCKEVDSQEQKQGIIKMSKKLKYYKSKTTSLENINNELFDKLSAMRIKLQSQFQDLYRFQIQNLKSQLQFERQKNKVQKNELEEAFRQSNRKNQRNNQITNKQQHQCHACQKHELIQSISALKTNLQQARTECDELKLKLKMAMKEHDDFKEAFLKEFDLKTMNTYCESSKKNDNI